VELAVWGAIIRTAVVFSGAWIVSRLYAVFISHLGLSFTVASDAFWAMILCTFLVGFASSVRLPLRRPRNWWGFLLIGCVCGFLVLRASPEGFLIFGLTPLANGWIPPMLGTVAGALLGAELSRRGEETE